MDCVSKENFKKSIGLNYFFQVLRGSYPYIAEYMVHIKFNSKINSQKDFLVVPMLPPKYIPFGQEDSVELTIG